MLFEFLTPIENDLLIDLKQLSSQHLSSKIVFHTENDLPDIEKIKIAIIGVLENRGDYKNFENGDNSEIRKKLYSLFPGNWNLSIADLGDVLPGETVEDTYFAVQSIVSELLKKKIIPIIIGGTQDLTYSIYRGYDNLDQMVNLVTIDNKLDFGKILNTISSESYLTKIISEEPNNLYNYSNLGYQTYYNSQEEIDLIDKLYFDAYRLGEVCHSISIAEPVLRDADIVSVDLQVVKSADSGNFKQFQPNGFNGKEICALSRYAGISDKVSCLGIFNHNNTPSEAVLIAQIIWYFIEGIHFRSNEYPFGSKNDYLKYIVPFENEEIIFYKSNKSDRWWIEINIFSNPHNKTKNTTLLPCSHEDYLAACNQDYPERWWKAQRKMIL